MWVDPFRKYVTNIRLGVPYDIYIGRGNGSIWGNPYSHKDIPGTILVANRIEAVERFEEYLLSRPDLMHRLPELRGKVLGCWCVPLACHGLVLARYANRSGNR